MAKGSTGCSATMSLGAELPPGIDPPEETIPGVEAAADCIAELLIDRHKVAVFADYDPDGTCGAAALSLALSGFEDQVSWGFAQAAQGTGLSSGFVRKAADEGVKLIVTVDLGSSDPQVLDLADSLGIKVVVSDHHAPHPDVRPSHHLNPALRGPSEASGAVVAYKLALALEQRIYGAPRPDTVTQGAFLASFGARADMMDMKTRENRALVEHGDPPPGLRAAARLLGLSSLSATNCSKIAALLNLPKRSALASAADSAAVLRASSQAEAEAALRRLISIRQRCADASSQFGSEAARQISEQGTRRIASAVIESADAHLFSGYSGIVAMRMSGACKRPALVFVPINEQSSRYKYSLRWTGAPDGSGLLSSIPALSKIASRASLSAPGGHPRAMGGVCAAEDIADIIGAMESWARESGLQGGQLEPFYA